MKRFFSHAVCAALLALAVSSQAQVTSYSDRPSFTSAASGLTMIDFNDQVTLPDTFTTYPGASVTLSDVTFTANSTLFAVTSGYDPAYDLGDGTVLSWQGGFPNLLTVALPVGTTAVGLDFGAFETVDFTFTLSTGDVYVLPGSATPTNSPAFTGFVSVAPITGLTISGVNAAPQLDRFVFGGASAVPEPRSVALLVGMASVSGIMLKRRRK